MPAKGYNAVRFVTSAIPRDPSTMSFVKVAPGGRYFMTEAGQPFLAIGHNEAINWPGLEQLREEQDVGATEAYIRMLSEHGVNVIRMMLEYCADRRWYFENPVGKPLPRSVQYWDNLVGLCERYRVRLLLTPWDTFFMSRKWKNHPYHRVNSGFDGPTSFFLSPTARAAQMQRMRFVIDRWGNSPAIFGYDLFNEIHPFWGGRPAEQFEWVTKMARFVKAYELERWGKRHMLTVSIFGFEPQGDYADLILCHPELDFATTHAYMFGHVDNPNNTIDCALSMRQAVKFAFDNMSGLRPYTDTENGPIHMYMDLKRQLPDEVDDEYYHNMAWAHLATGGAGSGMRWPFRLPHTLTPGMHAAQLAMSRFLPALDWLNFSPCPVDRQLKVAAVQRGEPLPGPDLPALAFGCADNNQALLWLLRDLRNVSLDQALPEAILRLPPLRPGRYSVQFWNTYRGEVISETSFEIPTSGPVWLPLTAFGHDLAIAIKGL